MARLVGQWMSERRVRRKEPRHPVFARRCTPVDVELLAQTDQAHETLSGPAVKRLFRRARQVEGNAAFARLCTISVSHIYNLRKSDKYKDVRVAVEKAKSRKVNIAERRCPQPKGRPGYLRVDTVQWMARTGRWCASWSDTGRSQPGTRRRSTSSTRRTSIQSIPERPPAVRVRHGANRPEGQEEKNLPRAQDYKTPYEKLVSLKKWEKRLKPGITPAMLASQARKLTDLEAAQRMGRRKDFWNMGLYKLQGTVRYPSHATPPKIIVMPYAGKSHVRFERGFMEPGQWQ